MGRSTQCGDDTDTLAELRSLLAAQSATAQVIS